MFTKIYIISQIITVIYYGFLCTSFLLKNRKKILFANLLAHIGQTTAMILLNGYTGAAMGGVMALRDVTFFFQDGKEKNKNIDFIIFVVSNLLIIILTIFTYNGLLSLLSVIASIISTYALYQKNVQNYKLFGIIGSLFWLSYNIFIFSIIGMILETVLLIFSVVGYIKDKKKL